MALIKRRSLLKAIGSVSLASFLPSNLKALQYSKLLDDDEKLRTIDTEVLIIGGGTAGVVAAIQAGRASALRILRFLRGMPGCEKTQLLDLQPETSVRETYRIDGEYQITYQDYVEGRLFDDALAYSFYPIDLHDSKGIIPKPLDEGVIPTIPLRALIPKHSRNLLVAGRCISSDRLANSALRVQASCMAMGQIAGATAALAVKFNKSPINVSIAPIKDLLTNHGAIVP